MSAELVEARGVRRFDTDRRRRLIGPPGTSNVGSVRLVDRGQPVTPEGLWRSW
jgi:hypothetical protein